jgi:hypothetical protein
MDDEVEAFITTYNIANSKNASEDKKILEAEKKYSNAIGEFMTTSINSIQTVIDKDSASVATSAAAAAFGLNATAVTTVADSVVPAARDVYEASKEFDMAQVESIRKRKKEISKSLNDLISQEEASRDEYSEQLANLVNMIITRIEEQIQAVPDKVSNAIKSAKIEVVTSTIDMDPNEVYGPADSSAPHFIRKIDRNKYLSIYEKLSFQIKVICNKLLEKARRFAHEFNESRKKVYTECNKALNFSEEYWKTSALRTIPSFTWKWMLANRKECISKAIDADLESQQFHKYLVRYAENIFTEDFRGAMAIAFTRAVDVPFKPDSDQFKLYEEYKLHGGLVQGLKEMGISFF